MTVAYLLITLGLCLLCLYITGLLLFSLVTGGPYSPSANWKVDELLKLIRRKKIKKAVDLGSGDGRIVMALAKEGIETHGFEINPVLVWWSQKEIQHLGLEKKAFIHQQNLWQENFEDYDLVIAYLSFHVMGTLAKKLWTEMKDGAIVITHLFKLPGIKPTKTTKQLYLYTVRKPAVKARKRGGKVERLRGKESQWVRRLVG